MQRRVINFGVIGCGLMGREFASAAARWCHLLDLDFAPRIVAACDLNPALRDWFGQQVPTVRLVTADYRELLDDPAIEAIYCAVPHHLHAEFYSAIIHAGKHLLGEKPFGIDLAANQQIMAAVEAHPELLIRCSSEMPFYPGAQRIVRWLGERRFGTLIEVRAGFLHSSDLDPNKPINWKRQVAFNGEYGCLGDLGMHVLHIPLRFGWMPRNLRALLSNIVTRRPGPGGELVACETWDNALLACEAEDAGWRFPLLLETKRIAPGETNTWYIQVYGTDFSAEFSTKYPKTLRFLEYSSGRPQCWQTLDLGYDPPYPTITGAIFEFGFSDALLQMWAAFCDELVNRDTIRQPFYCATPAEAAQSHQVFTAALESQRSGQAVAI